MCSFPGIPDITDESFWAKYNPGMMGSYNRPWYLKNISTIIIVVIIVVIIVAIIIAIIDMTMSV